MIAELTCCTSVLLRELEDRRTTQPSLAVTYCLAMQSTWATDWRKVNEAIIKRWSFAGLNRVKQLAHKLAARQAAGSLKGDGR